jgi:hypothetical protein
MKAKTQTPARRTIALRNYLQRSTPKQLQEFLNRAYLDLLKSPSQKTGALARKARRGAATKPRRPTKQR